MKLRVIKPGLYNDQFNKASFRKVNETFETLPAYGASLVESGYVVAADMRKPSEILETLPEYRVRPAGTTTGEVDTVQPVPDTPTFTSELDEVGLSHRSTLALRSAGYRNRDDLSLASDDDLLSIVWIGKGALEKIRRFTKGK